MPRIVDFFDGQTTETDPTISIILGIADIIYFGDPDTDGTWRERVESGNKIREKRVGGEWIKSDESEV